MMPGQDRLTCPSGEQRWSQRDFRPGPLPIATIGQLLWAGQGITSPRR